MSPAFELSVAEARARVLADVRALEPETVSLLDAAGRVLAADAISDIDIAPFDNSMMDGFAVRAADLIGASAETPVTLAVTAALLAGDDAGDVVVSAGTAVRIMTGAMLPGSADAVVMVERTSVVDGDGSAGSRVAFAHAPRLGENVRRRAEEAAAGTTVLAAGQVLGAAAVGLLAATGHSRVSVVRRPRIAVLSTGDELVAADALPGRGKIRDANGAMLATLVAEAGAVAVPLGVVPDDEAALRSALLRAAETCDAVVVSGGVSVGDRDFVGGLLGELGVVYCRRVAMRPGAPNTLGRIGDAAFFGLPGNPASAWVGFQLFVRPALRAMSGHAELERPAVVARLSHEIVKKQDRPYYVRARLTREGGELSVSASGGQSSALLGAAHRANCLVVLEQPAGIAAAGTPVFCLRLDVEEGTP